MSLLHRGISIELRPVEVLLFFRLRLFRNGIISAGFRFGLFDLGGSGFRSGAVQFNTTRWLPCTPVGLAPGYAMKAILERA